MKLSPAPERWEQPTLPSGDSPSQTLLPDSTCRGKSHNGKRGKLRLTVILNKRAQRLLHMTLSIVTTLGLSILPLFSAILPPAMPAGAISNGFAITVAPATAGAPAAFTIDMVAGENYAATDTLTFTFAPGSTVPGYGVPRCQDSKPGNLS